MQPSKMLRIESDAFITNARATVIRLNNVTDHGVYFKVKTAQPDQITARPNTGIIPAHNTTSVEVTATPIPPAPTKYKLMIMSAAVPADKTDVTAGEFWKTASVTATERSIIQFSYDNSSTKFNATEEPLAPSAIVVDGKAKTSIFLHPEFVFVAAKKADSKEAPKLIGPLPTSICYDSDSPTLSNDGKAVAKLLDALEMMAVSASPEPSPPGWAKVRVHNAPEWYAFQYTTTQGGMEIVNATEVVLTFLRTTLAFGARGAEVSVVTESETLQPHVAQIQKLLVKDLQTPFSSSSLGNAATMAIGYCVRERLQTDGVLLVDLTMQGCALTLLRNNNVGWHTVGAWKDDKLKSEMLRQNQRRWLTRMQQSAYPEIDENDDEETQIENSSYIVDGSDEPPLHNLCTSINDLLQRNNTTRNSVKAVVLIGDVRPIPLLNNLLCWTFPGARVASIVGSDVHKLTAWGGLAQTK